MMLNYTHACHPSQLEAGGNERLLLVLPPDEAHAHLDHLEEDDQDDDLCAQHEDPADDHACLVPQEHRQEVLGHQLVQLNLRRLLK